MKLKGSGVAYGKRYFSPFSFLFCFVFICLFIFALLQKNSSPNYRHFRSFLLYYTVFLIGWISLFVEISQ